MRRALRQGIRLTGNCSDERLLGERTGFRPEQQEGRGLGRDFEIWAFQKPFEFRLPGLNGATYLPGAQVQSAI